MTPGATFQVATDVAARNMDDDAQHEQLPPQRGAAARVLSVSEAAALYNFPEERLRRRLDAGGVPGAYKRTEDGSTAWYIPESSLAALGYAPPAPRAPSAERSSPAARAADTRLDTHRGRRDRGTSERRADRLEQLVTQLRRLATEDRLTGEVEALDEAKPAVETARGDLDAAAAALAAEREQLEAAAAALAAEREQLEAAAADFERHQRRVAADVARLAARRQRMDERAKALAADRRRLTAARRKLDAEAASLASQRDELGAERARLAIEREELAAMRRQLEDERLELSQRAPADRIERPARRRRKPPGTPAPGPRA